MRQENQRLYDLISQYSASRAEELSFCDEFYLLYDLTIDKKTMSKEERQIFDNLNSVASRFSPYEKDHQMDSRAFAGKLELDLAIAAAKKDLLQISQLQDNAR